MLRLMSFKFISSNHGCGYTVEWMESDEVFCVNTRGFMMCSDTFGDTVNVLVTCELPH